MWFGESLTEFDYSEIWRKFDKIYFYWDLRKAWKNLILLRSEESLTEFNFNWDLEKAWQNLIILRSGESLTEFNYIEIWKKFDRI